MRHARSAIAAFTVGVLTIGLLPGGASAKKDDDRGRGRADQPVYVIDEVDLAETIAEVEEATGQPALSGEISGAAWVGQIPDNWNGDLVIYAHGFRGEGLELTVDPPPEYEYLVEQGFAWAASSYRRNSYDPGIGVRDTKNVTRKMQRLLRQERPRLDETYIVGVSMGGHVTAAAIERYPRLWDGALPACGVVGDVELFDYFLDYNLGAAALAGVAPDFDYPSDDWTATQVPVIKEAFSTDPTGAWAGGQAQLFAGAPSPLTEAGESFKDFVEIGSGGDRVTFDAAWNYWHGLVSPTGDFFFDLGDGDGTVGNRPGIVAQNSDTDYLAEYGFDIDDDIVRVQAARYNRRPGYSQAAPIIKGRPSIPVLSIHTTGDLFVPIEMEQIYAREVERSGRSHLLVQRAIRDIGHCSFTSEEWQQSYNDLFEWVEHGVTPAGDDLINDISSPSLGCDFTIGEGGSQLRGLLEPCPETDTMTQ